MANFANYLPLSLRARSDESRVNANWGAHTAVTLNAIADILSTVTPEQWETPSLCEGWRVQDVVGHLVWRTGSSNGELPTSIGRAYLGHHVNPNKAIDDVSKRAADAQPTALIARLRQIAAEKAAGRGRTGISELTEAVVHGIDLAEPLSIVLPVAPAASGAVALRRSLIAPTEIKAVLRTRVLVATDADWRVGAGTPLERTAQQHLIFLFGREKGPLGS